MRTAIYDKIGKTYDATRRADPEILQKIINGLAPNSHGYYLDVGCGSGNYTIALAEKGYNMCGLDLSSEMLSKAQKKNQNVNWVLGDALALPFLKATFDGAICVLATHHIGDIEKAFQEVSRVINKGRFVVFTALPEQVGGYWLWHYFPALKERAVKSMASLDQLQRALAEARLKIIKNEKFVIKPGLQDWFLNAGKHKPEIYLDSGVRSGISTFALHENSDQVLSGCKRLEEDICSGRIDEIVRSYEKEAGDYTFIVSEKT